MKMIYLKILNMQILKTSINIINILIIFQENNQNLLFIKILKPKYLKNLDLKMVLLKFNNAFNVFKGYKFQLKIIKSS